MDQGVLDEVDALCRGNAVCGGLGNEFGGEQPDLFTWIIPEPPGSPPGQYLAAYRVQIDLSVIKSPAQTLTLNLPGREPETVTLQHWEPRTGYIQIADPNNPLASITIPDPGAAPSDFSWRWYGRSASYTVALTTVNGVVAGRIAGADYRYAIDPDGRGNLTLGQVNSAFWTTHPDDDEQGAAVAQPASMPALPVIPNASALLPVSPWGSGWDAECSGPVPGGQHVIDVLTLYSEGILSQYDGNVTAVEAKLKQAMDNANQAMRNSGIHNVVLSPRGPELLPNEPDTGAGEFNYDVQRITAALDHLTGYSLIPVWPYVAVTGNPYVVARRNAQWADVVALARRNQSGQPSCGKSWVNGVITNNGYPSEPGPGFDPLAYLVFDPACDDDRLNFAHEMGHQLGIDHDPRNFSGHGTNGHATSCPWSFGHRRSDGDARFHFRTVMAYWQGGSGSGGPLGCGSDANCPLIDSYSTPVLEWAGLESSGGPRPYLLQPVGTVVGASPIGIAVATPSQLRANGADTIPRVAPTVAAYRARPEVIFSHGFE